MAHGNEEVRLTWSLNRKRSVPCLSALGVLYSAVLCWIALDLLLICCVEAKRDEEKKWPSRDTTPYHTIPYLIDDGINHERPCVISDIVRRIKGMEWNGGELTRQKISISTLKML